jgi:hypothetical protein
MRAAIMDNNPSKRARVVTPEAEEPLIPNKLRKALTFHCKKWEHNIPILVLFLRSGKIAGVFMCNPNYEPDPNISRTWSDAVRFGRVRNAQSLFTWFENEWEDTRHDEAIYAEFDLEDDALATKLKHVRESQHVYPVLHVRLAGYRYSLEQIQDVYDFYALRRLSVCNKHLTPPEIKHSKVFDDITKVFKIGIWDHSKLVNRQQ